MNLCLETAQFDLNYGIQGAVRPSKKAIFEMLEYAFEQHIRTLDTTCGYGKAESLIGDYFASSYNHFNIISKLPCDMFQNQPSENYLPSVKQKVEESLIKLKIPKLQGLLIHNPAHLYDEAAVNALHRVKELRLTHEIGVSVYEPEDARYALELGMDIIQIPSNIFDRRFDVLIKEAKDKTKLYVRNVYLQGLLLMDAKEDILTFEALCKMYYYSKREVALSYMKSKQGIHGMIIGADNLKQLKENLSAYYKPVPSVVLDEIASYFNERGEKE